MGMAMFCTGIFWDIGLLILIVSSEAYWVAIVSKAGSKRSCVVSLFCGAMLFVTCDTTLRKWGWLPSSYDSAYVVHMLLSAHAAFHLELYNSWCTNTVEWIDMSMAALSAGEAPATQPTQGAVVRN